MTRAANHVRRGHDLHEQNLRGKEQASIRSNGRLVFLSGGKLEILRIRYSTVHDLSRGEWKSIKRTVIESLCEALGCAPGDLIVRRHKVGLSILMAVGIRRFGYRMSF